MKRYDGNELFEEKQKLYVLIEKAKDSGMSFSKAQAIIDQSEKIDQLIIKYQINSES